MKRENDVENGIYRDVIDNIVFSLQGEYSKSLRKQKRKDNIMKIVLGIAFGLLVYIISNI